MNILAFDAATERASVALLTAGTEHVREAHGARTHSVQLLPMIEDVLAAGGGLGLAELDAITYGRGPGSFTGVRLAVAVAQGLGFATHRRLVPVSDLALLACAAMRARDVSRVLVATDARLGELYWCAYERDARGLPQALTQEQLCRPENLSPPPGTWFAIGSAWERFPELLQRCAPALGSVDGARLPHAREALAIAARALEDESFVYAEQASPVYLREQVADVPPAKRE